MLAIEVLHDIEEMARGEHPQLLRAVKWVAILSEGEARSCLRDYVQGYRGPGFGCEAVAHFGGPQAVVERAYEAMQKYHFLQEG